LSAAASPIPSGIASALPDDDESNSVRITGTLLAQIRRRIGAAQRLSHDRREKSTTGS
jgi:hypothetical protein